MTIPCIKKLSLALLVSSLFASPSFATVKQNDAQLLSKAKAIHKRVLTLDTHADIDINNFVYSRNYAQDLDSQVTLPKMIAGGLDVAFFIVYTGQTSTPDAFDPAGYKRAYDSAINMFEAIHRMTTVLAPKHIEFARSVADVHRIAASGKKVALIGVENAYPLGDENDAIKNIKNFYERGARYISLSHQGHSQFSDSNSGEQTGWKWNGLSPLGVKAIAEMNRLGIMVDVSHPSKESMMQTLKITKAPIIASHSSIRAIADVSRNMDDEQLLALKENKGVIQIVGLSAFVKTDSPERKQALKQLLTEFNVSDSIATIRRGTSQSITGDKRVQFLSRIDELDKQHPPASRATVSDFVDHIDYAVKKVGIDHVGISSDFDGGGGIIGWEHAGETLNVTTELVRRGYTEKQIGQLWSGNLLRVMSAVEKVAIELQKSAK